MQDIYLKLVYTSFQKFTNPLFLFPLHQMPLLHTQNHKMKSPFILLVTILFSLSISAQDITGTWYGALKIQGTQLRINFNITKTDTGYNTTMDSPDQGAKGIPVTVTTLENSKLTLQIPHAKIEYSGELKMDSIIGTFKQNGMMMPLSFSRKPIEKKTVKKPQEPVKPYTYYSEEVVFQNSKANINLAGTLTLPKKEGNFPVVILITGSGPQNRDEELLGHKPFLVLADYLTKNGIAVLRYDDRGIAESKGNFGSATTADFVTDVESAVDYLKTRKEINKNKIGLMGHSEGGTMAPIVSSTSKDINFIVLLAGTGLRGDQLLLIQEELIARASGTPETAIQQTREINTKLFDMVIKSNDTETLKADLTKYLNAASTSKDDDDKEIDMANKKMINQLTNPWMQYFIKLDPATALAKVKCPVLAVNGEKDLQVPPKENLSAIDKALKKGGNKNITIHTFPSLNHLFQECTTGSPTEYADIEQTFSPTALEYITKWIVNQTK